MNPDHQEILGEFKALERTDTSSWEKDQWNRAVHTPLGMGRQNKCYVYSSKDEQNKDGGEWLYDVTWCEYEGDFLKSVPVVADVNGVILATLSLILRNSS